MDRLERDQGQHMHVRDRRYYVSSLVEIGEDGRLEASLIRAPASNPIGVAT